MLSVRRACYRVLRAGIIILVLPDIAFAYGGPGSVISGLGAVLAALAAVFVAIFGFFWFPLKRLYQKVRGEGEGEEEGADEGVAEAS